MRVILFTSSGYTSARVSVQTFLKNSLLKKHGIEVVGIVSAAIWTPDKKGWNSFKKFLKKSGPLFAFKSIVANILQTIVINFARYCVPDRNREIFEISEMAEKHKIPHLQVSEINTPEVLEFVKKHSPDMIASCLLLQIVQPPLLKSAPQGAINFHPALFQEHRGVFSSFWALFQNKKTSGATVHFMTEKPDEGAIILQKRFFISPSDTIHCVNLKSAKLGGNLLVKALVKIKKKKKPALWIQKLAKMFGLPTQEETAEFKKKGKHHMRFRDVFKV